MAELPEIRSLEDLATMVCASPDEALYLRFSAGPGIDREARSGDEESGCPLPGPRVSPLTGVTGRVIGRGPDFEPLLVDVRPLARIGLTVMMASLAPV